MHSRQMRYAPAVCDGHGGSREVFELNFVFLAALRNLFSGSKGLPTPGHNPCSRPRHVPLLSTETAV